MTLPVRGRGRPAAARGRSRGRPRGSSGAVDRVTAQTHPLESVAVRAEEGEGLEVAGVKGGVELEVGDVCEWKIII